MKNAKQIKKELVIMIKAKIAEIPTTIIGQNKKKLEHAIVEQCRQEMNKRHGKGWRDSDIRKSPKKGGSRLGDFFPAPHEDETSPYYGHENGEYWMD